LRMVRLCKPWPGSCRYRSRVRRTDISTGSISAGMGECLVRFDNEQGKGDHKHVMGEEVPYTFRDIPTLLKDFRDEIERAGGTI